MPGSAVGRAADRFLTTVLQVVGSSPKLCVFFFFNLFFSIQCIFEDTTDQTKKNFQGNIAFTLSDI